MKREKFLWFLTQSHHRALLAAKRVREGLAHISASDEEAQVEKLSTEIQHLYNEELEKHFRDEETMLDLFEAHVGKKDPDADRVRHEHQILKTLLSQKTKDGLLQFAQTLVTHIRFEEDTLFGRVEIALNEPEKQSVKEILEKPFTSQE